MKNLLIGLLILSVSICAFGAPGKEKPTTPVAGPTAAAGDVQLPSPKLKDYKGTITFYTWEDIRVSTNDLVKMTSKFMKEWASYYPGLTLKQEAIPGEQYQWISLQFQAGSPPDFLNMYVDETTTSPTKHPDWWYQWDADLQQKNPYSPNPRWLDDFPYSAFVLRDRDRFTGGKTYHIGQTITGTRSVNAFFYNQTMLKKAGITTDPAAWTWKDFIGAMEKLKAAGFIPWYEQTVGDMSFLGDWGVYELSCEVFYDFAAKIDGIIPEGVDAGSQAIKEGYAVPVEFAYALKKGLIKLDDPLVTGSLVEFFRLRKQWMSYTQPGYLAPAPQGEDLFRDGKAAMRQGGIWDATVLLEAAKKGAWELGSWGNVPKITDDVSPFNRKNKNPPFMRIGGGGQPGLADSVMVPLASVKNNPQKLAMIKDFLQWYTAPAQSARFRKELGPPSTSDPNAQVSEIFPDPVMRVAYRGFYDPPSYWPGSPYGDKAKAGDNWMGFWPGPLNFTSVMDDGRKRIEQQVFSGALTPEAAATQYKALIERELPEAIRANPTWNADKW